MESNQSKFTPYQWKLLAFLSVATFFEGFDFMALSQILPELRAEFGLNILQASKMIAVINIGTVFAFFLIRKADHWGRKRVLTITIIGYTIFTGLSALSQNAIQFAIFQLIARIFLIGEWGVAMVYAAEEFPAEKRGLVIGLIQGFSSFGSIFCAGVTPLLITGSLGWRVLYLVGIVPLILVAVARKSLKESNRFQAKKRNEQQSLLNLLKSPYGKRLLLIGVLWSLTYLGFSNSVTFWKDFAVNERGWTAQEVGGALTIAAVISMPLIFASGKLLDVVGRRWGAVIIYILGSLGVLGAFLFEDRTYLQISIIFAIFGVSGVLPVLNAYGTELFPTKIRGEAYAWGNNILGRVGYVLAPILIGATAALEVNGKAFGLGNAMAISIIFPMIALLIIMTALPETSGKELESTAEIPG